MPKRYTLEECPICGEGLMGTETGTAYGKASVSASYRAIAYLEALPLVERGDGALALDYGYLEVTDTEDHEADEWEVSDGYVEADDWEPDDLDDVRCSNGHTEDQMKEEAQKRRASGRIRADD